MSKKKLIVFFDGTWNSADQHTRNGEPCPTNITKLFQATLSEDRTGEIEQIVHYVPGVGTRGSERLQGGGFGYGISDTIKDGYRFLVGNYNPDDEIYIFGFSRGAYAARSLGGLIRNVGILKREELFLIHEAYDRYRDKAAAWSPRGASATAFRRDHAWGGETIRFLGVFETVGALGAPFGIVLGWIVDKLFRCSFHDTQLSSIVESAYHAVALDERRLPFMPTLMTPNTQHNPSNFEEKWFPGVHSDVGGGYRDSRLSDLPLEWMASKASGHGLNLDLKRVSDPVVAPDLRGRPHQSQGLAYRIPTVLTVKLPGYLGLVPKKYEAALAGIGWNGDYIRPVKNLGLVSDFIGQPPVRPDHTGYQGDLNGCVIDKINQCWGEYRPPNVLTPAGGRVG